MFVDPSDKECGEIQTMGVLPNYRGQGYGQLLMRHGIELLQSHRVKQISLSVETNNISALSIYQKIGFKIMEKRQIFTSKFENEFSKTILKTRLLIKSTEQVAELWEHNHLRKTFMISTAAAGLGCEVGSYCTPTGCLRVAAKIGENLPLGGVLRSRVQTGEIWSNDPSNSLSSSDDDLVLTRLLWLDGIDEHNTNTLNRFIYLHGTNQEHLLGTPASHGCVRFSNKDIVEVFDLLSVGSLVEIV